MTNGRMLPSVGEVFSGRRQTRKSLKINEIGRDAFRCVLVLMSIVANRCGEGGLLVSKILSVNAVSDY